MKNMFNDTLKIYAGEGHIDDASREANNLMMSAFAEDFRKVSPETLAEFLRAALSDLDEYDLCSMLRNVRMPADARSDMMYNPTYAITAAAIWLMTKHPARVDDVMKKNLSRMMDSAFKYGIVIHGFDDSCLHTRFMALLGKAGARQLIDAEPDFCPSFTEHMNRILMEYRQAAWEGNPKGTDVLVSGFSQELENLMLRHVLAIWEGKCHAVFTYGTLMRGQPADRYMQNSIWGGSCLLRDYAMYNLGRYPGIVPAKGETVLGEVWFVDDETLATLDDYEGEGSLYLRKQVCVESAYGKIDAAAYIYNHTPVGDVMDRKWGSDDEDYLWYAAYGSSMSSKRFACYVMGGICPDNGRAYEGCNNKTAWTDDYFTEVKGRMYFGKESGTWGGGVAFFDASKYGSAVVHMYRITRGQLVGVMKQEGRSKDWYGHVVCLGLQRNGEPIYTLTSNRTHAHNAPSDAYFNLIKKALVNEAGLTEKKATKYLKDCMK